MRDAAEMRVNQTQISKTEKINGGKLTRDLHLLFLHPSERRSLNNEV